MNRSDAAKLVAMSVERYPAAKQWEQEAAKTVAIWANVLHTVPYPAAHRALATWFLEQRWPPDPVEVREAAFDLMANCNSVEEREALDPGWSARPQGLTPEELAYSTSVKERVNAEMNAKYGPLADAPHFPS